MEEKRVWQGVLAEIEVTVSRGVFVAFFSQADLVSLEKNVATISCPNTYISTILEERYYSLLKTTLEKHLKKERISLVFSGGIKPARKDGGENDFGPLFNNKEEEQDLITNSPKPDGLRGDFTFETFAVSSSNQLAFAAAEAVSRQPGKAYNPFFVWGGVGVGKTHLMQAVGWEVWKKTPAIKIIYCSGEDFTNEIVEAIRTKRTAGFKSRYRSAEVLLIDDVQFIAGKETVQEEFFHTFNAIHRGGGQIILTSDRPPSDISKLEDRLRSRFEGGMIADIAPPDFELRSAILLIKAKAKGKELPIDVAKILAANITDNRKMEGALIKLLATADLKKLPITKDLALEILGERSKTEHKRATAEGAMSAVCGYFDLKPTLIKGGKRDRPIARPRQILMYILRTELNLPYVEIGDILGGRDHSTIIHGEKKISRMVVESTSLREDVEKIKEKLYK